MMFPSLSAICIQPSLVLTLSNVIVKIPLFGTGKIVKEFGEGRFSNILVHRIPHKQYQ